MTDLAPEEKEKTTITVFGATGFAGERIVKQLMVHPLTERIRIGIAGRSNDNLTTLLNRIREELKQDENSRHVSIITADCNDFNSLVNMCSITEILINCVGPYRFYGEIVVKACIKGGCNYIDISGEPQFIETSFLKYSKEAEEKDLSIIHACGFDSMPADLGVLFASHQFKSPEEIHWVESVLSIECPKLIGHSTTFHALIEGLSGEAPKMSNFPIRDSDTGKWFLKFPGSDASVVRLSQHSISDKNPDSPLPHYRAYFTLESFSSIVILTIYSLFISIMIKLGLKSVVKKFPRFFSFGLFSDEGPSEDLMNNTKFIFNFKSHGLDKSKKPIVKHTTINGPDPGYKACAIFAVEAALTLLHEFVSPGVFTPASAFYKTKIISNLQSRGIQFDVKK